jgi:hypothetical protein
MVHALREIWRVLKPGQSLIDLRPLAGQSRVELSTGEEVLLAGLVDEVDERQDDLAADRAITQVVADGRFSQVRKAFFDYATYWDTPDEMQAYAEARWTKSHLPGAVLARTRQLIATTTSPVKLRIRRKLLIARYKKQSH